MTKIAAQKFKNPDIVCKVKKFILAQENNEIPTVDKKKQIIKDFQIRNYSINYFIFYNVNLVFNDLGC